MTLPITRQGFEQIALVLGVGVLVFAVLAFLASRRGRRPRRQIVSAAILGALALLSLALGYSPLARNIPTPTVPLTARFLQNPLADTPDAWAAGQAIYQVRCAVCHGVRADGQGPAAFTLNPRPVDFHVHVPMHAPGEIFYWIGEGIPGTAMPAWKDQVTETERWQLVRFLYALIDGRVH